MLNEFLSIAKDLDIPEITGLDDRCIQILFFLLLDVDKEYNHNQLIRELNKTGLYFKDPTFSRHLDHLEEKELIKRIRNYTTTIKLNVDDMDHKLKIKQALQISIDKLNFIRENLVEFTPSEIFFELKQNYMEKASASLLIKLRYINNSIPENEFRIGYLWFNTLYEFLTDIYIDELSQRGPEAITEVINLYYQHSRESDSQSPSRDT